MLYKFIAENAEEIVLRARAKVARRVTPTPTEIELKNGVPLFLRQIVERLHLAKHADNDAIKKGATLHGGELLGMGFTVGQVIRGYGDVCQVVTQLADEKDVAISAGDFNMFNRCLDDAIAGAVVEYERLRDESVTADGHSAAASLAAEGTERQAFLVHEMRDRLSSALLAFEMLQEGMVPIGGSTGALLGRSLRALVTLVTNSLASVRLESGLQRRHRVSVLNLVREAEVEASLATHRCVLAVSAVAGDLDVEADQQMLSAALGNLLQNAFKFSRPGGHVALRTTGTAEGVVIEVEDECGGLPPGDKEALFRPFKQGSSNRTGLGIGLSVSRKGVEAMGGEIRVRDLPGKGCIFSIHMPRLPVA